MFTNLGMSICDRLRQRYGNSQQFSRDCGKDFEYIQYIVNFIIEQAKHSIVISELPDVIRTLHCEAETILRKNRMITLQEVIAQVQKAGAMKYPYLRKLKPTSMEDFIKEVIREVFDRLGTIITLDKIENICQFTTCSAKQLLQAMPSIDVNEAATLIIEDISRNQRDDQNRKLDSNLTPVRKEHGSLKSTQNSHASLKNVNKNQQSRSTTPARHFTQTILTNPLITDRSVNEKKAEIVIPSIINSFPVSNNQKISLCQSQSNTQTYSIHSEEGLSLSRDQQTDKCQLKILESIRHYSKYCYQHSDMSDNEEEITENCPLEDILHHRLLQPT